MCGINASFGLLYRIEGMHETVAPADAGGQKTDSSFMGIALLIEQQDDYFPHQFVACGVTCRDIFKAPEAVQADDQFAGLE